MLTVKSLKFLGSLTQLSGSGPSANGRRIGGKGTACRKGSEWLRYSRIEVRPPSELLVNSSRFLFDGEKTGSGNGDGGELGDEDIVTTRRRFRNQAVRA